MKTRNKVYKPPSIKITLRKGFKSKLLILFHLKTCSNNLTLPNLLTDIHSTQAWARNQWYQNLNRKKITKTSVKMPQKPNPNLWTSKRAQIRTRIRRLVLRLTPISSFMAKIALTRMMQTRWRLKTFRVFWRKFRKKQNSLMNLRLISTSSSKILVMITVLLILKKSSLFSIQSRVAKKIICNQLPIRNVEMMHKALLPPPPAKDRFANSKPLLCQMNRNKTLIFLIRSSQCQSDKLSNFMPRVVW